MPFISLDGREGVGKSTQIQLLENRLPIWYPDYSFVFTREPGGTELGEMIQNVILSSGKAKDADGQTMFGLFAAARVDHVRRVIRPALERGNVVVCESFVAATWAYQVFAQKNPAREELFYEHLKQLDIFPELTILLDTDPEISLGRIRAQRGQGTVRLDEGELAFHARLREGYDAFAGVFNTVEEYRITMIDANQSIECAYRDIFEEIEDILG